MNLFVQWSVVLGIWWAILVDLIGDRAGQPNSTNFTPIIEGTVGIIVVAITALKFHLVRRLR